MDCINCPLISHQKLKLLVKNVPTYMNSRVRGPYVIADVELTPMHPPDEILTPASPDKYFENYQILPPT